jgi:hypothetical protein
LEKQTEQTAPPVPRPAKKKLGKKKKKKVAKVRAAKPLPAPVESSPSPSLPFLQNPQRNQVASSASASSSVSEPKPGQPLSAENERLLHSVPEFIGEADSEPKARPGIQFAASDAEAIAGMLPDITFDPAEVQGVLEEMFDWWAEKFDSAHWKLTERQSRMLAKPTAELLSSLYLKIGVLLPGWLMSWCEATPGLMGFLLTSGIVIGPKVAVQFQLSRSRRKTEKNRVGPQRVPAPIRPAAAPAPQPHQTAGVGLATPATSPELDSDGFPKVV